MKKDNEVMQIVGVMKVGDIDFEFYGDIYEPLFLASNVAILLDERDGYTVARKVNETEKVTQKVCTLGGVQKSTLLTEFGLYEVFMKSNKKEAMSFHRDVKQQLKQIRLTGGYIPVTEQDTQEDIERKAQEIADKTIKAKDTIIADLKTTNRLLCKDVAELTNELEKKCRDMEALDEHIDWIKDSADEAYKSGLYGVMAFEDAYELLEPSMVGFNKFRQFLVDKGVLYYEKTSTYLPTKEYSDMFFKRHENNNRLRIRFTTIGNAVEFIQLYKEYIKQEN